MQCRAGHKRSELDVIRAFRNHRGAISRNVRARTSPTERYGALVTGRAADSDAALSPSSLRARDPDRTAAARADAKQHRVIAVSCLSANFVNHMIRGFIRGRRAVALTALRPVPVRARGAQGGAAPRARACATRIPPVWYRRP